MKRRELMILLGVAVALPLAARAQQPATQRRIALVHRVFPADQLTEKAGIFYRAFFAELPRLGYREGGNLVIERYSAEGHPDRFADLARQVVGRSPDLVIVLGGELAAVFKATADTIPIIAILSDPIKTGTVASLARPGGSITGISLDAGFEIYGKRLQLLKELLPAAANVGFLAVPEERQAAGGATLPDIARSLGIALSDIALRDVNVPELQRAFSEMAQQRLDAIMAGTLLLYRYRRVIAELAEQARLPAIYPYREFVEEGGLICYGPDLAELGRRTAQVVHEILGGAKPGDIPIYQPQKFELMINLKTAKALGLTVPQSMLMRADEVIE
jgi:putative ABC transport system substrate-binding protein